MTIRLVLVDDHAVMREALGSFLEKEGDIAIVGQAADGARRSGWWRSSSPMWSCSTSQCAG